MPNRKKGLSESFCAKHSPEIAGLERPRTQGVNPAGFGSDVAADTLRDLGIQYIALNPGASYRGLHDSIVNHLGNSTPQILLCLHEEAAVAIAHGYAKVTGKAMAAAVHSNVGLMHASMAIFNAWCDRMPVIVVGATGPVDAAKRRPWIDWIHTSRDQGALVRNFTKWDDQPASPDATREAILRAGGIANAMPKGPVYINLDTEVQEMKLEHQPDQPYYMDVERLVPTVESGPSAKTLRKLADMIVASKRPVILAGRVSRDLDAWNRRVELAELIGARVGSRLLVSAAFPTDHPLHIGAPSALPDADLMSALKYADLIISLDWLDLGGTFKATGSQISARVIQISMDHYNHNGWSMDYMALAPLDLMVAADPDEVVDDLLPILKSKIKRQAVAPMPRPMVKKQSHSDGRLTLDDLALRLKAAVGDRDISLTHLPISWQGHWWPFRHPLDFLGSDGGGGIGGGPGISVGCALALRDIGRLPIAICGDGDYLMGVTALWTAVHYRIPILFVIANNSSFYNDEVHQERIARLRNRPVENKWIGQRISDPDPDLAGLARSQGAQGFGPINRVEELDKVFAEALSAVENGNVAVVDIHIEQGYSEDVAKAMLANKTDRG